MNLRSSVTNAMKWTEEVTHEIRYFSFDNEQIIKCTKKQYLFELEHYMP